MKSNNRLITKDQKHITETQACGVYGIGACMQGRFKLRAMLNHEILTIHGRIVRRYRVADVLEARKNRYASTTISNQPPNQTNA